MGKTLSGQLAQMERQANLKEAADARAKAVRFAVAVGIDETTELRKARGEVIEIPTMKRGEQDKPRKVKDGWDMAREAYIRDGFQGLAMVGDRYANIYRTANGTPMKIGCEPHIKGAQTDRDSPRDRARQDLHNINRTALAGIRSLIVTLEAVCGNGMSLTELAGQKHAVPVHKDRLSNALALVGVYWGLEV